MSILADESFFIHAADHPIDIEHPVFRDWLQALLQKEKSDPPLETLRATA